MSEISIKVNCICIFVKLHVYIVYLASENEKGRGEERGERDRKRDERGERDGKRDERGERNIKR